MSFAPRLSRTLIQSTTRVQKRAGSGVHYNPPTGRLFGEQASRPAPAIPPPRADGVSGDLQPPPKGQKRVKQDWEDM